MKAAFGSNLKHTCEGGTQLDALGLLSKHI